MELIQYNDYKTYMRDELERRTQANRSYSLRAFARDLGISPALLSGLLNQKRGISVDMAIQISEALGLNWNDTGYFCDLVKSQHSRNKDAREMATTRAKRYRLQSLAKKAPDSEAFKLVEWEQIISKWYHFAIFEMIDLPDQDLSPAGISQYLGITQIEAKNALQRLVAVGLIEKSGDGFVKNNEHNRTPTDIPSKALRKLSKDLLARAGDAIETQPIAERDFSTMTMVIDKSLLPEAKKKIRDFRREMMSFLESGEKQELYCLGMQLFSLKQTNTKQNSSNTNRLN